jgi:hypothetical protein
MRFSSDDVDAMCEAFMARTSSTDNILDAMRRSMQIALDTWQPATVAVSCSVTVKCEIHGMLPYWKVAYRNSPPERTTWIKDLMHAGFAATNEPDPYTAYVGPSGSLLAVQPAKVTTFTEFMAMWNRHREVRLLLLDCVLERVVKSAAPIIKDDAEAWHPRLRPYLSDLSASHARWSPLRVTWIWLAGNNP